MNTIITCTLINSVVLKHRSPTKKKMQEAPGKEHSRSGKCPASPLLWTPNPRDHLSVLPTPPATTNVCISPFAFWNIFGISVTCHTYSQLHLITGRDCLPSDRHPQTFLALICVPQPRLCISWGLTCMTASEGNVQSWQEERAKVEHGKHQHFNEERGSWRRQQREGPQGDR